MEVEIVEDCVSLSYWHSLNYKNKKNCDGLDWYVIQLATIVIDESLCLPHIQVKHVGEIQNTLILTNRPRSSYLFFTCGQFLIQQYLQQYLDYVLSQVF